MGTTQESNNGRLNSAQHRKQLHASCTMSFSRVYDVTNALHLGDGAICVETTPQHGSMLSANLDKYTYGSWLNMPMWVDTDANETCAARATGCRLTTRTSMV